MTATIVTFLGYTCQVEFNGAIIEPSPSAVEYGGTGWSPTFNTNDGLLDLNLGGWIGPTNAFQRIYLVAKVDCVLNNGVWTPDSVRAGAQFWLFPNDETVRTSQHRRSSRFTGLQIEQQSRSGGPGRKDRLSEREKHTWATDPASPLALINPSIPIDFKKGVAQIDRGALELVASNIRGPITKQVKLLPPQSHSPRHG